MKLSIRKMEEIASGLTALDGYQKDGKIYPFELSGTLRRIIGRNLAALRREIKPAQAARDGLINQMSDPDKPGQVMVSKLGTFALEEQKLFDAEEEVSLTMLKASELKLETNPIPGSALASLDALLED